MLNVVFAPAVTLRVAALKNVPGIAIGGSRGVRLEPPVKPEKMDSTEMVYVPGGRGIS